MVRVNVHSQSCAGLLCGSTVMTLVDKPWKVDFCVPPDPCLVLITEPTLQAAPFFPHWVVLQNTRGGFCEVWEKLLVQASQ